MEQKQVTPMDWSELLRLWNFENIVVTIKNPVRKDDWAKKGRLAGFKAGLYGGGHRNWQKIDKQDGSPKIPYSYDSSKRHWIKRPKVLVVYNCFVWGGSEYNDWVDVDNCEFTFKEK